jgi:diacylglycerol O-acyltransferase / wax synthase
MMGQRMSPADAVWYLGENPANPMMISSILWFDRTPDIDQLRALYTERVIRRHPVFRERIVPSRLPGLLPRWEEYAAFDIDEHFEVHVLPAPGDHETLERLCSEQRSQPLDRSRPLWKVDLFTGYRGDGCAMHTRIHHSIGDGLALMTLLLGMADEFGPDAVPIADDPEHAPLGLELLQRAEDAVAAASRAAFHPEELLRTTVRSGQGIAWGARLLAPAMAGRTGLLGQPSGRKRMAWDPDGLPLEAVKATGRQIDMTVNDVLLALLSGALHRYLIERGELVDDVLMMVPINLREPGAPLPRHLGNQIGLLPVRLPVGMDTAAARLAAVHDRLAALKDSPAPAVSRFLLAGTSLLTPPVEQAVHRLNQIRSTGVVTNVPGPQVPLHLAGARIVGTVGWGGMTGHLNLSAAFVSLGGRVFSGIVTDERITPDPDRILTLIHEEWLDLPGRVAA